MLWWSDFLWNVGNALLAVASIGSAISTTISHIVGKAVAPKLREVIFNWLSTTAGAASTAAAFIPYRRDLSTVKGKISQNAISAYENWIKKQEKERLFKAMGPVLAPKAVSYEPRIKSLERELHENLLIAKEMAQSIWNSYVNAKFWFTKRMNEALDKASNEQASCILVNLFAQELLFLLDLIRPTRFDSSPYRREFDKLSSGIREIIEGIKGDNLKKAVSPLTKALSSEARSLTISGLIVVLKKAQEII